MGTGNKSGKQWPHHGTVHQSAHALTTVAAVRVATWNLWWRFGDNWHARYEAIAATLEAVDADVVCCQEVWAEQDGASQAELLADRLGMELAHHPRFGRRGLSFGNAVLSRTPIVASESHTLEVQGESGHRTALVARIARASRDESDRSPAGNGGNEARTGADNGSDKPTQTNNGEMTVICTHLEHRFHLSEIRQGQVATLCELAAPHHDPEGFPVVMAGDFNAVPTSDEIRLLTGERPPPVPALVWSDAWAQAGDGPGYTWDGRNPYLSQAMWPNRRIDYVFVATPRPVPHGNIAAIGLIGTESVDGVMPSDHYGLAVDLID